MALRHSEHLLSDLLCGCQPAAHNTFRVAIISNTCSSILSQALRVYHIAPTLDQQYLLQIVTKTVRAPSSCRLGHGSRFHHTQHSSSSLVVQYRATSCSSAAVVTSCGLRSRHRPSGSSRSTHPPTSSSLAGSIMSRSVMSEQALVDRWHGNGNRLAPSGPLRGHATGFVLVCVFGIAGIAIVVAHIFFVVVGVAVWLAAWREGARGGAIGELFASGK
jgi:hypothetical protein